MKHLCKVILALIFVISVGNTAYANTYTELGKKYCISKEFLKSYDELSKNFYCDDGSCKKLEKIFRKYEDPYLTILIFEYGEKKGLEYYDKGSHLKLPKEVCERSQQYESNSRVGYFEDDLKYQEKPKPKKKKVKKNKTLLGTYTITAYCSCSRCCGKSDGITASGTHVQEGRTIACGSLPIGTRVYIEGVGERTVEDRGVNGAWIDLYINSHSRCLQFGMRKRRVYLLSR